VARFFSFVALLPFADPFSSSPTSSVTRAASAERHYDDEEKGSANGSSATNEKKHCCRSPTLSLHRRSVAQPKRPE
jgi:hypothetical protein